MFGVKAEAETLEEALMKVEGEIRKVLSDE